MAAETTTRVLVGDAAKAAVARQAEQGEARAAEKRRHYIRDAKAAGERIGVDKLGDYGKDVEWTPEGDGDSDRFLQATATIDGLRFRATERYYSAGEWGSGYERTLYLRQPCPDHAPADRELEIHGLADLGAVLANPASWETARCFACQWRRDPENPENQRDQQDAPAPSPPTVEERLAGVLREYVDAIVGERLDGFLATYLPDRI